MMKTINNYTQLLAVFITVAIILSFSASAFALDDGARAYWKAKEGTQGVSYQHLRLDLNTANSQQFDPGGFIYANSDIEAEIFMATWVRHSTMFDRPSTFAVNIIGGDIDVDVNANIAPAQFLPPGVPRSASFTQSSSGYGDPSIQLVNNLFGTPKLKSNVDLVNYEPTWTLDSAVMLSFPVGEYDNDKLVNIGQNRWFGRIAFPYKYHFGVFSPGYMSSFELTPSVWLFDKNDDFMGQKLENDPIWQLEAHLTQDFTRNIFGSLDVLYRTGFGTAIDGLAVGDDIEIGNVGFSLNYHVNDNMRINTGYSSNVFGDDDLENSLFRIQFIFGWNKADENAKKLMQGH